MNECMYEDETGTPEPPFLNMLALTCCLIVALYWWFTH